MKLNRRIKVLLLSMLVIIIALIGSELKDRNKEVTNYTQEFEEEQTYEENDNNVAGVSKGIEIPGYKSINIVADKEDVRVDLTNPESNDVYFQISFYLPDTDEIIYTSKLIKPGQHIYDITLEHGISKGEYPLTIKYATFSADDSLTPRNGADVNCILIAE